MEGAKTYLNKSMEEDYFRIIVEKKERREGGMEGERMKMRKDKERKRLSVWL